MSNASEGTTNKATMVITITNESGEKKELTYVGSGVIAFLLGEAGILTKDLSEFLGET